MFDRKLSDTITSPHTGLAQRHERAESAKPPSLAGAGGGRAAEEQRAEAALLQPTLPRRRGALDQATPSENAPLPARAVVRGRARWCGRRWRGCQYDDGRQHCPTYCGYAAEQESAMHEISLPATAAARPQMMARIMGADERRKGYGLLCSKVIIS